MAPAPLRLLRGANSRAGHGPKDPAFNADEMRALVDEAHAPGAPGHVSAEQVLEAGAFEVRPQDQPVRWGLISDVDAMAKRAWRPSVT